MQWANHELHLADGKINKFNNLVSSDPAGIRAMNKICLEAIKVTAMLATTLDRQQYERGKERFWELYFGPMYIVEVNEAKKMAGFSQIETAMVAAGNVLKSLDQTQPTMPRKAFVCMPIRSESLV